MAVQTEDLGVRHGDGFELIGRAARLKPGLFIDGGLKTVFMKRLCILLGLSALVALAYVFKPYVWAAISPVTMKFAKAKTVAGRLNEFGETARGRWKPYFDKAQIAYPPVGVKLVALKTEKALQIYARG